MLAHFEAMLRFRTDCWDLYHAITEQGVDSVLVDVRKTELYAAGHLPTAINILHGKMINHQMKEFMIDTVFAVYCAGPHCIGANKTAARLAKMGRSVKLVIGRVEGQKDEGFDLASL